MRAVAVALIRCTLALFCTLALTAHAAETRMAGDRLEFGLPGLDGKIVKSSDPRFAGKVVLLGLWGTWCPPCLSEIPTLVDLQTRYGPQGLVVVAIAFEHGEGRSRRKFLRSFSQQQGINYLVLDGGLPENVATALPGLAGARGFPFEILVDRAGQVASARHGGGRDWAATLEAEIQALLKQPVAAKPAP